MATHLCVDVKHADAREYFGGLLHGHGVVLVDRLLLDHFLDFRLVLNRANKKISAHDTLKIFRLGHNTHLRQNTGVLQGREV